MKKLTGKYDVKEIKGVTCAVVEEGVNKERADFLLKVLEHNGYKVHFEEKTVAPIEDDELPDTTYTVAVEDITFNLALALYSRHLKTLNNKILDRFYWFQEQPE